MNYYPQKESDQIEMKNIFNSLYLIIQIFYDLNAQVISKRFWFFKENICFGSFRNYRNILKIILIFI